MPRLRGSDNVRERYDDGICQVVVYERTDRPGFRVITRLVGARPAERAASTLDEARALAEVIWRGYQHGDIAAPPREPVTIAELRDRVCALPPSRKAQASYRKVWDLFVRHIGPSRAPRRVWRLDVVGFLDAVDEGRYRLPGRASAEDEPTSAATLASYHRTLRAGFRWALKQRWIADCPTDEIEIESEHAMGTWMPYSEWETYLTQCSPAHAIRSGVALETGMRVGEIAAARPEWIRGEVGRRAIAVAPDPATGFTTKWGTTRVVPLTAAAEDWITRARAMWPESRYLFSSDGLSALGNLARETRRAVDLAGVTRVTFHGLRRSAGAHWIDCGLSLFEVSRLLGHRSITTTERWYAGISDSTLVGAISRVDAVRAHARAATGDVVPLGAAIFGRK